jgi:hypothetical protein
MEPHREDQPKALEPSAEPKPKRFRIVKLEERIAPTQGGRPTWDVRTCPTYVNTCICRTVAFPCTVNMCSY